jgi:hypothetical protein
MNTTSRLRLFTPRNASEPLRRSRRAAQADDVITRQVAAGTLHTRWS